MTIDVREEIATRRKRCLCSLDIGFGLEVEKTFTYMYSPLTS